MKVAKYFGIATAGLIALLLIVAALLPSSYQIERSIVIEQPPEVIFAQISSFEKWNAWSPWFEMEPSASVTFAGKQGEPGASMSWAGEKLGEGSITLETIDPGKSMKSKLAFKSPSAMETTDQWILEKLETSTKVRWQNLGNLDYPMGRIFGLFLDRMMGPDFERGLTKLKATIEGTDPEDTDSDEPALQDEPTEIEE